MTYLLDTNVCVLLLRQPNSQLWERLSHLPQNEVALCSVVEFELRHGAEKSQQPHRNHQLVTKLFTRFKSLPFDDQAASIAGSLKAQLARVGLMIGPYDLLIAGIALANKWVFVTHNVGEFSRVPGLKIEDWQST